MKHCFILNPAAGKGDRLASLRRSIEECCTRRGVDYEIYETTGVGDATAYVRRTAEADPSRLHRMYACGGDGTLGETVTGALSLSAGQVSVGVIPSGTGNDFVRNFAGKERFFDIDAQLSASEEAVDVLRCNEVYALNMVNIGFDCEVVCKTAQLKRKKFIPSRMAYVAGLIVTLLRKPGVSCRRSLDGEEAAPHRELLNTYGNGSFCGGGFHSNPLSSLRDGRIDGLFVKNIGRIRFLSLVGSYKKGTHLRGKYDSIIENRKARRVDLYFDEETSVSVDGELLRVRQLHLSVLPRALRFLVPAGATLALGEKESAAEATAAEAAT